MPTTHGPISTITCVYTPSSPPPPHPLCLHCLRDMYVHCRVKENKVEQFKPVLSNNNNNSNGAVASSVRASPLDNPPPPPVASPPHERNNANNANPASGMSQLKHGERRGTGGGAGALSLRQSAGDFKAGAKGARSGGLEGGADIRRGLVCPSSSPS